MSSLLPRRILWFPALLMVLAPTIAGAHPGIHEHEEMVKSELAESPTDPDRHVSLGRVQGEKREWDAALASYATARRLGADDARISLLEGGTYLEAGWPRMAKVRFDTILETNPDDGAARLGRARTWMKLEHPEEAAEDYRVAISTLPSIQPGYVLEYKDALVAADRSADAVAALDTGIARLGQVPSLQLAAIDTEVEAERYDDALRRVDLLLTTSPGHPQWSARRAEILELAGRNEEARLAYVDALEHIQIRTARRRAKRLDALEQEVRAAIERNTTPEEPTP